MFNQILLRRKNLYSFTSLHYFLNFIYVIVFSLSFTCSPKRINNFYNDFLQNLLNMLSFERDLFIWTFSNSFNKISFFMLNVYFIAHLQINSTSCATLTPIHLALSNLLNDVSNFVISLPPIPSTLPQ